MQQNQFPMTLNVTLLPETITLIQQAEEIAATDGITIETAEDYRRAAGELQKVKGLSKSLDAARKQTLEPINTAKDEVMGFYKPMLERLTTTENLIKTGMTKFDDEQEKARRLAEAKAAEEARKEQEKLEAKAEKLAEKGKTEQAQALQMQAASVVAAPVAAAAPVKVAGISKRISYSAEVNDIMALVQAVAAGQVPINAIQADTKFLNQMAKALKDNFSYPGCSLKKDTIMSSKSENPF